MRLRERFLAGSKGLSELETLELLLTYAIPRQDVAPLAGALLDHFGDISGMMAARYDELMNVSGVGDRAAMLIKVVAQLLDRLRPGTETNMIDLEQPALFELDRTEDIEPEPVAPEPPQMSTYANDEVSNILRFVPEAARFAHLEDFKAYLRDNLPYNSDSTRQRRTNYIIERLYPSGQLDIPLTYYSAHCSSEKHLKPAVFYHIMKAEPLAARVAEDLIWPAVPRGSVDREEMREFILRHLPDLSQKSQTKVLRALFNTYHLLSIGLEEGTQLRIQMRAGTLNSFVYVLTSEFPKPGMYGFESLEQGPMRHWLLWDREWMRRQLYNLRDLGIISKISEIDAMRQFTLGMPQMAALRHYFEESPRDTVALREEDLAFWRSEEQSP